MSAKRRRICDAENTTTKQSGNQRHGTTSTSHLAGDQEEANDAIWCEAFIVKSNP